MGIHLAMLVIARRAISYYWSVSVVVYIIGYVILFFINLFIFSLSLFRINPKMKKKEKRKRKREKEKEERKKRKRLNPSKERKSLMADPTKDDRACRELLKTDVKKSD